MGRTSQTSSGSCAISRHAYAMSLVATDGQVNHRRVMSHRILRRLNFRIAQTYRRRQIEEHWHYEAERWQQNVGHSVIRISPKSLYAFFLVCSCEYKQLCTIFFAWWKRGSGWLPNVTCAGELDCFSKTHLSGKSFLGVHVRQGDRWPNEFRDQKYGRQLQTRQCCLSLFL